MKALERYLTELRDIRSSGAAVKETSYYPALANLLNDIGKELRPQVRCIITLRNRGAGLPDGGLFTPEQFQRGSPSDPLEGQVPSRGVIEVKPTSDDAWIVSEGEQVTRYWGRYRQVLVTNYRDFLLIGQGPDGKPLKLESYRLAPSEAAFWRDALHPCRMAEVHGERFGEYLKRVMRNAAPLVDPGDLAWFFASYAREAKARIEGASLPALDNVRSALEEALGLEFRGKKGEHFFRSTLIQTLFYGVFSAWVLWSRQQASANGRARFDWAASARYLRVPVLRKLFHEIADPGQLEALDLSEVLDWAGAALNRVDRRAFFAKFEERLAVQHFYEPFLRAFDPDLRKELGVWYTPPEIIQYMVERVDQVLRSELDVADGLADPRVYVLDPCCGTGGYLVEVVSRIADTLRAKGEDALLGDDLKRAVMERVIGFEILPAPFVVAHLQLNLLLQNLGAPLAEKRNERVGVYLTNALTGWDPSNGPKQHLLFRELEEERDAAEKVKQESPILVVLGNPPYNAFAGVSPKEERGLVEVYKTGLVTEWGIKKFNLDDLYVRFFRLAERRIAERTGRGVVCLISNYSWLTDPSFVVMRQHLLESFDRFWIENMHGDRKISEYGLDRRTSETVFATRGFSVGIQQGVAISLWVKNGKRGIAPRVLFRDDINASTAEARRKQLLDTLAVEDLDSHYTPVNPERANRFLFLPLDVPLEYGSWPSVVDLAGAFPTLGILENRKDALVDIDREPLEARMRQYYDPAVGIEVLAASGHGLAKEAARFDPKKARERALKAGGFEPVAVRRAFVRPMDYRWCYYTPLRPIWNEPRPWYAEQVWAGNLAFATRRKGVADPEGPPFCIVSAIGLQHSMHKDAYFVPIHVRGAEQGKNASGSKQMDLLSGGGDSRNTRANLSDRARRYLAAVGITADVDRDREAASLLWMHALAIGYSPAFLTENRDGIRHDWPRIPLPSTAEALHDSASLGRQIAALLDTESPEPNVTSGSIRPDLRVVGVASRVGGGSLRADVGELALRGGWGFVGKGGVKTAGKGKLLKRPYSAEELEALREGASQLGLSLEAAMVRLGDETFDAYLNEVAYWKNIPVSVWNYTIGGYQLLRKWLSYREEPLLGRSLTPEEVRTVTHMARRVAAILLLEPRLDSNYQAVETSAFVWDSL